MQKLCNGCRRAFLISEIKRGRCSACLRAYYRERGTTTARGYGGHWQRLSAAILARDNYICRYCGGHATTVDHIIPKSKGGTDRWDNLVACCRAATARRQTSPDRNRLSSRDRGSRATG